MNTITITTTNKFFTSCKIGKATRNGVNYGAVYYNPGFVDCFLFIQRGTDSGIFAKSLKDLQDIIYKNGFVIVLKSKYNKLNK